ncbi:P-loop NTPase fold protein [Acinetobacter sp. YK3]|uniref:KAP family P-loop NTPase fold protein n=1 Tax=Acinetobacter sp. YK3 TaxID=1860097 RepID=UPI00084C9A30|nr:P-loop NTPase fold protein [Acinetobacter sp. YK3]OEC84815.1 NTPase [Acinetobacter sp. YK3]
MNRSTNFIKDREEEITVPFQGDLWGREKLGERLTDFVSNLQCGATIALDAEWGAGKTWFVKNWKADLEEKGHKVIYIDAFAHDFMEDPFLILSMEILNTVEADTTVVTRFKDQFIKAYHAVLPNLPMLIWSLAMTVMGAGYLGKMAQDTFATAKEAAGEVGEKAGELLEEGLKEHLTGLVEDYNTNKNELKYFQEALANLVKDLDTPLVFIVDELDRCKPEFSIKLIERIKHFFDIPNIVFILSTIKNQLEESINSFYGFKSANIYLEKFIDLNFKFPKRDHDGYKEVILNYTQKFNLRMNNSDILLLSKIFNLNSRDLIRVLQKMALLNNSHAQVASNIAFIFLAMDQKSLKPSCMTDKYFFDKFLELLREYVLNTPSFGQNSYDFDNLDKFAHEYGKSMSTVGYNSGLPLLLKIYYVLYTNDPLNTQDEQFKNYKQDLFAPFSFNEKSIVKSWDNYINFGFIVT